MKKLLLPACLLLAMGLAGCGGSTTTVTPDPVPTPTPVPVDAAVDTLGADMVPPTATSDLTADLVPDTNPTSGLPKELLPPG